jgi:hypothetical protein
MFWGGAMEEFYSQLMSMNEAAFKNRHYEAAYHLLAAAMHYAKDRCNLEGLKAIQQRAHEQRNWINTNAPENILSTESVQKRHGIDLFHSLIRQLEGDILIVRHNLRKSGQTSAEETE